MKKKYSLLLFLSLSALLCYSQNLQLNKYTFGEGLQFTDKNKSSYSISGFMQPWMEIKKYASDSLGEEYLRFRLRRLRLRLSGDLPKYNMEYRFQIDLSGTPEVGDETNLALFDSWIAYNPTSHFQIKFGQSSSPTENLELLMGSNTLQLPERSRLTSAFAVAREFGVFASGEFKAFHGMVFKPAVAITNGDGQNAFRKNYGGFKYGGRLDVLPFGKFNHFGQFRQVDMARELTPKLLVGFTWSRNHGVSSRRGESGGTILYLNDSMEESLPNFTKFGVDLLLKYKGFSLIGEFVHSNATVPDDITIRVRNDGTTSTAFLVNGVQNVSDYVKGRMMLGTGYNMQAGYLFKNRVSVDARYTYLKADANSFMNNPTYYNRPKYYTIGLSKYISRGYGFKIQGSITYAELAPGSLDINSYPISKNEWIGNIIATISF
jgi:hypothetical protein